MKLPSGYSTYDYSVTPAAKGWGPGWPNCGSAATRTVTAARSGAQWTRMDVRIADLYELLVNEIERRGYLFVKGWCWGGACRQIAGTNRASNHSWFLAADNNAPKNPYNSMGVHDIPGWAFALLRAYGFGLGADYKGAKKDWMHAEFQGTPSDAVLMTALARRNFGGVPITQAAAVSGLLQLGAKGDAVRRLQERLVTHGAKIGVDGDFGPATDRAVRDFQSMHNLDSDGIVGPKTLAALNVNPTPFPGVLIREGGSGQVVIQVQQRLIAHGVLPAGQADGKFGPRTAGAVKEFQRRRKLDADGIVGPATWSALHS